MTCYGRKKSSIYLKKSSFSDMGSYNDYFHMKLGSFFSWLNKFTITLIIDNQGRLDNKNLKIKR